jgi:hypothetical protein
MATLVFSYAHADESLRDELEKHLSPLQRMGRIDTWHDRRVVAGEEFEVQIDQHFASADIVLLLVSPDFIASDYCYQIEMTNAVDRHNRGEAVVIPVILRPCAWHQLPFGKLLAGTIDAKPITQFNSVDEGFVQVVDSVSRALDKLGATASSVPQQGASEAVQRSTPATINTNSFAPRSSNLALRKSFSDRDKDRARKEGIEFLARFFENSLNELEKRNPGLETDFSQRDAAAFECTIYQHGSRACQCGIWSSDRGTGLGDICYSQGGISPNSWNESITVEDDGHILGYRSLMGGFGSRQEHLMTAEGMAEHLWDMFIRPLK